MANAMQHPNRGNRGALHGANIKQSRAGLPEQRLWQRTAGAQEFLRVLLVNIEELSLEN